MDKFAGMEPPVHRFKHRIHHPIGSDVIAGAGNLDLYLKKPGKNVMGKVKLCADGENPITDI